MERLEKEYKHEIDILELKSKNNINEQSQNVMNTVLGDVVGTLFNGIITGNITPGNLDKITKQCKKKL